MYWEIQRVILQCPECGNDMTAGSLVVHRQTHHGVDTGGRNQWETPPRRRSSDV